mgnify:CR=1 FL=1
MSDLGLVSRKVAKWLMEKVLPSSLFDDVCGDLDEEF